MTLDRFSLCTVPITQLANRSPMTSATAFAWKLNHQPYLITNWHVITGRNTQTGKLEAPARPDTLRAIMTGDHYGLCILTAGASTWLFCHSA
jgi:hypothetical protein